MRILLVNHTFPPESYAGSELCVLHTAQEFQRRGHETAVFYRYHDAADEEYQIRTGTFESIPIYKINHTYRCVKSFQAIYLNPAIAAKFGFLLSQIKPDVVHFHHLTNLSLSLIQEAKLQGCVVIMTLHDYWLLCQRGQLLKRDLELCHGPSEEGCRSCLALPLLRDSASRLALRLGNLQFRTQTSNRIAYELLDISHAEIQTPDPQFVGKTTMGLGEETVDTLLTHPPAAITYPIQASKPMHLETAIALHPSTYSCGGKGVGFEILLNDQLLHSKILNPKKNPEHQGWHPIHLPIPISPATRAALTLRTFSEDPDDNQYCTAGWRKPVLIYANSPTATAADPERIEELRRILWKIGETIIDAVAAFSPQASEGIHHRNHWIRRVFTETDLFISPSQYLRKFFIQHGLPEAKIVYSDNGFVPPPATSPKPLHDPLRFGYIGTWIPSKGVDLLLQAFQEIDPAAARLWVYGFFPGYDGYPNYDKRLQTLAGEAVEFRGKYDPAAVYSILNELDCLVMPSIWWENSPLTLHEAFLAQVPVITADVGGMAEQVQSGGGLTFRHRNVESLRRRIGEIIRKPDILYDLQATIPRIKMVSRHAEELLNFYASIQPKRI